MSVALENNSLVALPVLDIVKKDPKLPDTVIMAPPSQRTTESVFDQEDKAKVSDCECKQKPTNTSPFYVPQQMCVSSAVS